MAPLSFEDTTSTGYEFYGETNIVYVRAYSYTEYLTEKPKKLEPIWLKGRKNKKDNFKLK